jgi:formylglycine-generating enzyme required for sulfatase activity
MLKPNDFGLFDMLGNAASWCQGVWGSYTAISAATAAEGIDAEVVPDKQLRTLRGGAFRDPARFARSAYRDRSRPGDRFSNRGIRPARTCP